MPRRILSCCCRGSPRGRDDRLLHVEQVPARVGTAVGWPDWVDADLRDAWTRRGIEFPWAHQAEAAELAHAGRHVVVSTGTASGKSLAYLMPALTAVVAGSRAPNGRGATALYLSPTKALAHDQWRSVEELRIDGLRRLGVRRRHPDEEREWIRAARGLRAHQPRHAAPLDAAGARALGVLPARAATTSWSTSATSTAASSARTWPTCCAGCAGSPRGTAPSPTFVLASATVRRPGGIGVAARRPPGRGGDRRRVTARRRRRSRCGSRR